MADSDPRLLHIRLARSLRDHLATKAEQEGVSLNNYIATLLAGASGWRDQRKEGGSR